MKLPIAILSITCLTAGLPAMANPVAVAANQVRSALAKQSAQGEDENGRRQAEARERLKKLLGDVVKLTGGVDVEHLSAERAHTLARELMAIRTEAEAEIEFIADDRDDEEVHRVFGEIGTTLGEIKKRIGDPSAPKIDRRRLGHPIPHFENRPAAEKRAEALRLAQHAFVDAINDSKLKRTRLVDLIVAEEALAWEAGWPFREGETKAVENNDGRIPRNVYLARLKRGIGAVRAQLASEHDAAGRRIQGMQFNLHVPVDEKLAELANLKIKAIRGLDFAWVEVSDPWDATAEASLLNPEIKRR